MRAPVTPATRADEQVRRGRELFFDARQGCASCHVGGSGTDAAKHAVQRGDKAERIDTPSLKLVSGTAPYFHDGRFETLDALLASADHAMGGTLHLHPRERAALAAYLETL
jgi:cytochrome c peroxidase